MEKKWKQVTRNNWTEPALNLEDNGDWSCLWLNNEVVIVLARKQDLGDKIHNLTPEHFWLWTTVKYWNATHSNQPALSNVSYLIWEFATNELT